MNLPDLTGEPKISICSTCGQPAKHGCGGCELAAYCSGKHQKEHWSSHREQCKAYKVLTKDAVGRYGVTSRTLEAGELILTETPVAVGPKSETLPLCLGCHAPVDCTALCSRCGWPVCSADCENLSRHANAECTIFSAANIRFQPFDDWSSFCPQYECITPLRLLLANEANPVRWENEVKCMESHNKERQDTPLWHANQNNIVDFLRKACKLGDRFNDEQIHTACGILDVNSFEIRSPSGSLLRGLYPQTAIMSHCCVANTSHSVGLSNEPGEEYRLRLRTSVRVDKGNELFTSYAHSLEPTLIRREKLRLSKYFDCRCQRCADPTELGTHLGSLKCNKCDNGIVISTDPLDADAGWKCTHCEFTTRGDAVRRVYEVIQGEIDQIDQLDSESSPIELGESIFRKYRSVLHPHHACMTSLRHTLANLYGRVEGYTLEDLPDILLERKIALCRDLLAVADVVEPGCTRLRALILYDLHAPILLFVRSQYRFGELNQSVLKEKLEEAAGYLEEAVNIFKLEDPNSPEGMLGIMGEQSLEQLRQSIQSLCRPTST